MKENGEWDVLGEFGEKILGLASKFQELKLSLVHRELQRMADDTNNEVIFTVESVEDLRKTYQGAVESELDIFTWLDPESGRHLDFNTSYARYLLEYLDQRFGLEAHG